MRMMKTTDENQLTRPAKRVHEIARWIVVITVLMLSPVIVRAGDILECGDRDEMGTPFKVCLTVDSEQKLAAHADIAHVFSEIRAINAWMSDWLPDTELTKVNNAAGREPVKVSADLLQVLKDTLKVSEESNGALDPTFNVMWGLYKFKKGEEREATDAEIRERLPLINWRNVVLDDAKSTVFLKRPGMKLGLGAVGQSYAADRGVAYLKSRGYRGGYVDGSGDTVFWGVKPGGALWTVGVRDPRDKDKVILRLYGSDFAVTTCGDDEKFFMKNGRRIHHVIDPKTGRPATKSHQITVIAKHGFDADAWDTASFVLGPDAAKPILERKGFRAVMVDAKGRVTLTKGLKKQVTQWGEGYVVDGPLQ